MFRKPSLISEYTHYYSRDPAFDSQSVTFDHAKLCETGDLKFAPRRIGGPEPTAFTLRPLTRKDRLFCEAKASEGVSMLAWWGVALALTDAKPMIVGDERHTLRRMVDGSVTRVCDYDMDLIASVDNGALLGELGERAWGEVFSREK